MRVLVVDTSTPAVTAALVRVDAGSQTGTAAHPPANQHRGAGVEVLAQRTTVDARAHGERLAPAIAAVLAEAGWRPRDLVAVVAGVGPGPFTGLRVGLATAASVGQALAIPTYGVCSLDAIGAHTTGAVLVATDARRKEIYWAVYHDGVAKTKPAVNRPDAVGDIMRARDLTPAAAAGDGALRYAEVLALPVLDSPRYPPAEALAALAAGRVRERAPTETLTPLYLRRPDVAEPAGGTLRPVTAW